MVLVMCPICVSKLINNTKIGIGKLVILWLRYGSGLELRPIFERKFLNNTKIGIG